MLGASGEIGHAGLDAAAEHPSFWDTFPDTWVATDALGRSLPTFEQAGPPRPGRFIGMFYFLWSGQHVNGGPFDVTKVLAKDPTAIDNKNSPLWGPMGAMHFWGEPLFGYYVADDRWVIRKHAQMLADAGVDVIIFDVTNQFTYRTQYMTLLDVFADVRKNGGRTPQVAFLCPFGSPGKVVRELYRDLYEPGKFPDLWFKWDGKPLILADPGAMLGYAGLEKGETPVELTEGHTLAQRFKAEKKFDAVGGSFPTWAQKESAVTLALYKAGQKLATKQFENIRDNGWLMLEFPEAQTPGEYVLEASAVKGKAGWWTTSRDTLPGGRALADGKDADGARTLRLRIAEGADTAIRQFFTYRRPEPDYFVAPRGPDNWSWLNVFPQHVFRNSRGEKEQMSVGVAQNAVAGRLGSMSEPAALGRSFHNGSTDPRPGAVHHGYNFAEQWDRALKEDPQFIFVTGWNEWIASRYDEFASIRRPVMFVDTFDQEHSRDIEPMLGGHGDNYYYQLAACIRRYKGVRKPQPASPHKTIRIDGDFAQWESVKPEYRDDIGDTAWRDHPGYNNITRYVNQTGRNDFVMMKVTRDDQNVYFYARTHDKITPRNDGNWMLLFIDADRDHQTGWEGYDVVVNRRFKDNTTAVVETTAQGWNWHPRGEAKLRVAGNELMLAVKLSDLGVIDPAKPISFDFKWSDNMQREGQIDEFLLSGDAAPNGRFNYRYQE
ncbi:MAG: hypothetical protein ABSH20_03610 [Tepidisphaeraceae bacterium]